MIRKRIAETQTEVASQVTSPDAPQENVPSKAEAVRILLGEGADSADEAIPAIKERFGLNVTRQQFSTYKSIEKTKRKGRSRRSGGLRKAESTPSAAPAAASTAVGQADMVDDLAVVKRLVERLGGEQVRKLVGLFE
jgi:hypothetical protein